jgi:hypothetical protein
MSLGAVTGLLCLVLIGCIDADQGAVVVKPQKPGTGSATSESAANRKSARRADASSAKLEQELAQVDELIRQVGGDEADKLAEEIGDAPAKSPIRTAFAEEPANKKMSHKAGKANRLAKESSPYLLLHAHNPVDWFPWGPEAF